MSKRKSSSPLYQDSLTSLTEDILKNMDGKKISLIVLLGMPRAFDSIQHERLLMKLHNIGVSTPALTWFESYFTQRSQFVMIEDDILADNFGLPQGSLLGPVLFTVYKTKRLVIGVPQPLRNLPRLSI